MAFPPGRCRALPRQCPAHGWRSGAKHGGRTPIVGEATSRRHTGHGRPHYRYDSFTAKGSTIRALRAALAPEHASGLSAYAMAWRWHAPWHVTHPRTPLPTSGATPPRVTSSLTSFATASACRTLYLLPVSRCTASGLSVGAQNGWVLAGVRHSVLRRVNEGRAQAQASWRRRTWLDRMHIQGGTRNCAAL